MKDSEQLQPCPFCCSAGKHRNDGMIGWGVQCENDYCGGGMAYQPSREAATAAWNKRAAPAAAPSAAPVDAQQRIAELEAALQKARNENAELQMCLHLSVDETAPVDAQPVAWIRKTDITEMTDSEPETDGWTPLYAAAPEAPSVRDWLQDIKDDGYRTDNERYAAQILLEIAPEAPQQDDAKDAARYRWLRTFEGDFKNSELEVLAYLPIGEELNALIDAEMQSHHNR